MPRFDSGHVSAKSADDSDYPLSRSTGPLAATKALTVVKARPVSFTDQTRGMNLRLCPAALEGLFRRAADVGNVFFGIS